MYTQMKEKYDHASGLLRDMMSRYAHIYHFPPPLCDQDQALDFPEEPLLVRPHPHALNNEARMVLISC